VSLSRRTFGKTQTHDVGRGNPDATVIRLPLFGKLLTVTTAFLHPTVSPHRLATSSGVGNRGLADTQAQAMAEVSTE
jgi:hypothetical protein